MAETRAQLRLLLGHSHAVFKGVEGITSASSKRGWQLSAGHRVNVPAIPATTWGAFFFLRAVFRWLGWTSRGTMTQIMREIVKVADTCTSGGHVLHDQPYAPHRRHSLDASGLRLQYHTFQQHRLACHT